MAGSGWRHEEREVEKPHSIRNCGSTGFIVVRSNLLSVRFLGYAEFVSNM